MISLREIFLKRYFLLVLQCLKEPETIAVSGFKTSGFFYKHVLVKAQKYRTHTSKYLSQGSESVMHEAGAYGFSK